MTSSSCSKIDKDTVTVRRADGIFVLIEIKHITP